MTSGFAGSLRGLRSRIKGIQRFFLHIKNTKKIHSKTIQKSGFAPIVGY